MCLFAPSGPVSLPNITERGVCSELSSIPNLDTISKCNWYWFPELRFSTRAVSPGTVRLHAGTEKVRRKYSMLRQFLHRAAYLFLRLLRTVSNWMSGRHAAFFIIFVGGRHHICMHASEEKYCLDMPLWEWLCGQYLPPVPFHDLWSKNENYLSSELFETRWNRQD